MIASHQSKVECDKGARYCVDSFSLSSGTTQPFHNLIYCFFVDMRYLPPEPAMHSRLFLWLDAISRVGGRLCINKQKLFFNHHSSMPWKINYRVSKQQLSKGTSVQFSRYTKNYKYRERLGFLRQSSRPDVCLHSEIYVPHLQYTMFIILCR